MAKEMIGREGINVCPKCLEREFKEVRLPNSYKSTIIAHGLSPENKKHKGKYMFEYECQCGCRLIEYMDLGGC